MISTVATASPEALAIGQTVSHRSGVVTVAMQRVGNAAWRVSVNDGGVGGYLGREVDGASFPTFDEALGEYARVFRAYFDGQSPAHLAERREALADLIGINGQRRSPEARNRAARYRRELDGIAPLAGRPQQLALAADVAGTMTRALADALAA